ncbi:MAG: hypothetical protein FWG68_07650 [Defluviitaleaceae bacterium]|nr:hypothetical protein [Defluviitaleaceae bacterium]
METILTAREGIIRFYKRFEPVFVMIARFLLGLYIFTLINSIGDIRPELAGYYTQYPLTILLAIAFAVLPFSVSYVLMAITITIQYSAHLEIAAIIFVFLICLILFYARMAAKESILIIFTILAYMHDVPYLIPLMAGLYFSITAIIPVAIGVFMANFIPEIPNIIFTTQTADLDIAAMPDVFGDIYMAFTTALNNAGNWVFTAFIFAMVIILVHVVSRLSLDFSKEIAIVLGSVLLIFSYIMASTLITGLIISVPSVILTTLLCALIAELTRLFDPILDYQRAESVQFEDDNNYYYVRVVPKIQLSKRKRVVRRIRPQPEEDEEDEYD